MPKPRKIYEVKTRDNRGDDGHQGDGSDNWPGGRGGGSQTERGGEGNNRGKKLSCKEIYDCTHIMDQYLSNTVYKDYSDVEKANFYELRLARLEKEVPQGNKKKYVRKIKSLQRQLDESRMGNDESDLSDSSHSHFEGSGLNIKDNKNCAHQGGPQKINKTKK